ncbi:hypothetical protein ABLO26_20795 [Neobacillus sp. 179-J 1A1 HS]
MTTTTLTVEAAWRSVTSTSLFYYMSIIHRIIPVEKGFNLVSITVTPRIMFGDNSGAYLIA